MKKSNSNNVNRNTSNFCQENKKPKTIFNNLRGRVVKNNLVTPEIFLSEIWMREGTKSGVEIIEINSSNSETEEPLEKPTYQEKAKTFGHAWSYINDNTFVDDPDYKINNRAREKWRKNHEELAYVNEYLHSHDTQTNFNGFHYIDDSQNSGMQPASHANCFTILNNHVINSDSSIASDQEYGTEEIESFYVDGTNPQNTYWDHVYKDDSVSYNHTNTDKRTVWIYSFKNQHRLSENDFEQVDILSGDSAGTSTSNSLTEEEENAEKGTNVNRISSPIPPNYMPRLDLSMAQTLSTVTELTEFKSNESLVKKPINNWLTERDIPKNKTDISDVVNWMSLSPRERRRRFKKTTIDVTPDSPIMKEYTYAEGNIPNESEIIQVDAEVHATDDFSTKPTTDLDVFSIQSADFVPQVKDMETNANANSVNVSYADADLEINADNMDTEFDECAKPCINLITNKTYNIITDPIEKLNSDYWIGDVVKEEPATLPDSLVEPTERRSACTEMKDNERCMDDDVSDTVSRRLWLKRTKLMKSPLWDQYLPITGTPLSLHLSMSLSSIESKKSWFRRIGKYLKCCR